MHLKEAILRKTAGPTMDPVAARLYEIKLGHIKKLEAQAATGTLSTHDQARLANLKAGTQGYAAESAQRKTHSLTDQQLTQQYQLKHKAQKYAQLIYVRARQAGKSDAEAKALGARQAKAIVAGHVGGSGKLDAFFRGGGRAKTVANYGKYLQALPPGSVTRSSVDPLLRQQMIESDPRYQSAQGVGNTLQATRIPGAGVVGGAVKAYADRAGNQRVGQAVGEFDKQYSTQAQTAPAAYAKKRGEAISGMGDWAKKNWASIAGLGMGALGLFGLARLGNKQSAPRPGARKPLGVTQPGVPEWAQNRHQRGYQSAGKQGQTLLGNMPGSTQFSSVFKNFMGGAR